MIQSLFYFITPWHVTSLDVLSSPGFCGTSCFSFYPTFSFLLLCASLFLHSGLKLLHLRALLLTLVDSFWLISSSNALVLISDQFHLTSPKISSVAYYTAPVRPLLGTSHSISKTKLIIHPPRSVPPTGFVVSFNSVAHAINPGMNVNSTSSHPTLSSPPSLDRSQFTLKGPLETGKIAEAPKPCRPWPLQRCAGLSGLLLILCCISVSPPVKWVEICCHVRLLAAQSDVLFDYKVD